MPGVTSEQIAAAKSVDLLSYLKSAEPGELKKTSSGEYRTVSHGSLVISNGKWIWNRGNVGGRSALDYFIKVRGMGFVDAVNAVLDCRAAPVVSALTVEKPKPQPEKKLILPKRAGIPSNAVRYLQRRGIHSEVINRCLKSGLLYEGVYKNSKEPQLDGAAVCVFIGRDTESPQRGVQGKERFASLRGIGVDLKRDASGSDKCFGFFLSADSGESRALAVFEAPIDLLSHATLKRRGGVDFAGHRLSLGGTSDVALMAYLERNPNIEYVSLCLDNDEAGRAAAQKISETLSAPPFKHIAVTVDLPENGKDYNETLLIFINTQQEQKKYTPRRTVVASL